MIYIISSKNVYAAERLLREVRSKKHEVRILDINDLLSCDFKFVINQGDVLYVRNPYFNGRPDYLPRIIKLAKSFKAQGGRVVDANITRGDLGKGKWVDYKKLMKVGLPIPRTLKYESRIMNYGSALSTKHLALSIFIIKWIYGMKAKGTFLIKQKSDFKKIPIMIPTKELMAQDYIEADYEYKVITIGYKALPVILRFKFNKKSGRVDFGSHKTLVKNKNNNKYNEITQIAEKASKTLGRELAKVDILEKAGKFYILEVNRFPWLESFEKLTKYNVFGKFLEYLGVYK